MTDDMGPLVVTPEPAEIRLGPLGTWMHARAFQKATNASREADGNMKRAGLRTRPRPAAERYPGQGD
jgi:hypothetical protein